jgi:predicted transcriptional regulator
MITNDVTHKKYLVGLRDTIILVLRRELGLTGADIALIMGLNKATVSRVLSRKKQKPSVEQLLKKLRQ